ncbi:MAG: hypothetical protein ABI573_03530 [Chloroflexota bacterium]
MTLGSGGVVPLEAAGIQSLVPTPGGFALLGNEFKGDGTTPAFLVSGTADGGTWTRLAASPGGQLFGAMAGGSLGWVAATEDRSGPLVATALWFSSDGITWEALPDQAGIGTSSLDGLGSLAPIAAGPHGFAIAGYKTVAGSSVAGVWVSRDGRTWAEATALSDMGFDQVLVLPDGFLAIANGCCAGLRGAAFSTDGISWRDLSVDSGSAFGSGYEGGAMIAGTGSTVVSLGLGASGNIEVVTGTFANNAGQTGISWKHDVEADKAFAGDNVSAMTSSEGNLAVVGYDRMTLAPITWTSTDARTWHRTNLDASTFGGGVPFRVAVSGATGSTSMAAVGYRVNSAGDIRDELWRSDDGSTWSAVGGDLLGVLPVAPTGPCPATTPTAIEDFLAMAPPLWPICFGSHTLRIRGVVSDCGGCGGATDELGSPSWLIDPLGYSEVYLVPRIVPADTNRAAFTIVINPAHQVTVPVAGTYVELTGHFADPAAATCRIYSSPGAFGPVVPRGRTVAVCEQSFVLTGIRTLPG